MKIVVFPLPFSSKDTDPPPITLLPTNSSCNMMMLSIDKKSVFYTCSLSIWGITIGAAEAVHLSEALLKIKAYGKEKGFNIIYEYTDSAFKWSVNNG